MKKITKVLTIVLSVFLLLGLIPMNLVLAEDSTLTITQLAPAMRTIGRCAVENNTAIMEFSGSGIEINLSCSGDVYANIDEDNRRTSLGVVIDDDDENMETIFIEPGTSQSIKIASDLELGTHKFKLLHLTEFGYNGSVKYFYRIKINTITFNGTLGEKPSSKKYNIEFYGDSITVGQGNLSTVALGAGSYDTWCEKSSVTATYESYCCNQLDADMEICAASGWGIGYSFGAGNSTIDKIWNTNHPIDNRTSIIDYNNYPKPDLVVMSLGTNDISAANTLKTNTEEHTAKKMAEMIKNVRSVYGSDTKVLWLVGLMSGGSVGGGNLNLKNAFNEAVNDNQFNNVWFTNINAGQSGGNYHPSKEQHKTAGTALANYITTNGLLTDTPTYSTYETTFASVGDKTSFDMDDLSVDGYNYSRNVDNTNYFGFYDDIDTSSSINFIVKGLKRGTYKMSAKTIDNSTRSKATLCCNNIDFSETDFSSEGDIGNHEKDLGSFFVKENGRGHFTLVISSKAKTGFLLGGITVEKLSEEIDYDYSSQIIKNPIVEKLENPDANCVASIGETQYTSLESAISNALSGDTIFLQSNIVASFASGAYPYKIEKDLTIDFNKHKIESTSTRVFLVMPNCDLKLINGTITQNNTGLINSTIEARNASVVVRNMNININAAIYSTAFLDAANYYGLWTLENCKVVQSAVSNNSATASFFYPKYNGTEVRIKNCNFDANNNDIFFLRTFSNVGKIYIYSANVENFKSFYSGSYASYYTLSSTLPENTYATLTKNGTNEQSCEDFSEATNCYFYCQHFIADGVCDYCGYEPVYIKGDLNNDGVTDSKDILLLKKYLANYNVSIQITTADLNDDNNVNLYDLLIYTKYLAGYLSSF